MRKRWTVSALISLVAALVSTAGASASGGPAKPTGPDPTIGNVQQVCARPTRPNMMSCLALRRVGQVPHRASVATAPALSPPPVGLGPADLQSAYKLPSSTAGSGQTVAIVDAFDDPNAESDLGVYRSTVGLPACTTANGCFSKVNQAGSASPLPASDMGWAEEISLDIDMVSAICPNCHILLVEANDNSLNNLGASVDTAVSLGAKFVSNSYGGGESSSDTTSDTQFYRHPGVAVTASSGDNGFGVEYPAASQFVTAVGGTSLTTASNSRGWTETAWSGAGSGCSAFDPTPSWQNVSTGCGNRAVADVSAVADPNTGVGVYDTFGLSGWNVFGGTSVASPVVASVYALGGTPGANDFPASYPYAHTSSLFDVTSGSNGSCSPSVLCTAGTGWDGPTGLGTPNGTTAFSAGGGAPANDFSISVAPASQTVNAGSSTSYTVSTAVTSGSAVSVSLSAGGLPSGGAASFSPNPITSGGSSTMTVTTTTGTPNGTSTITVTGTSSTTSHSATTSLSVTGGASTVVTNGGFETGTFSGWTTGGAFTPVIVTSPVHSGTFAAQVGSSTSSVGGNGNSTLTQTIHVPSGSPTLTFWYNPHTSDTIRFDQQQAQIRSTSGQRLAIVLNVCSNSGTWTQVTFSMSQFAGQTVVLWFNAHDDGFNSPADPTWFYLDDVSVA